MKRQITLIAVLFFLSAQIFAQTWNYVNSTGTSFILYGMSFSPGQSSIGYACGMQYTYNADGVVVKTVDGGANWTQVLPASGDIDGLQGIWFISDDVGFASGWNNYFIKTTDGGTTWTDVTCGTNVWYYRDVEFWDANNGVATASMNSSAQSVFITSDGGDTWVAATSGVETNDIMGLSYADANTVIAVGTSGNVYESIDGGHNWTIKTTIPAMLFGVDFANTSFGVVGGEEKMFATNDGGSTWTTYTTGYENFYGAKAMADGTGYIGGTDENIYKTTDFGVTWSMEHNGAGTSSLYRIRQTDNGNLFACGSQGTIITTTAPFSVDFTSDLETVCAGGTVNFTDLTSGSTSWNWTFEGGTPATSTDQNPTVVYNTPGVYDVELEASDGIANGTLSISDMITVIDVVGQANTPVGDDMMCTGFNTEYTTDAVEFASSYIWEVLPSDAGTITGDSTIGTFYASDTWTGAYTVRVMASNSCGNGDWSSELECQLYLSPAQFNLSEGGVFCEGGDGVEITLDGSEVGVEYILYGDGTQSDAVQGTGNPISFGFFTTAGYYSAEATAGNCIEYMIGDAIISIDNLPVMAGIPLGPETICSEETSEYTIEEVDGANSIIWTISPEEAGTISGDELVGTVTWANDYEGEVEVSARGQNDCGAGSSEGSLTVMVYTEPSPVVEGDDLVCQLAEGIYSVTNSEYSTYDWTVDGGEIREGQGTNEITVYWTAPQGSTTYVDVTETKMENCEGVAETFEVTIDQCVGVEENYQASVKVYPNPANSILNISLSNVNSSSIVMMLINPEGKVIIQNEKEISNESINSTIDVSGLPQGIYYVIINSSDKIIAREKVVIIK